MSESRRLIILVVEPGAELGLEYEGTFANWEVMAVLHEAMEGIAQDIDAEKE